MAPVFHVLRFALNHDQSSHALVAVSSSSKDASSDSEPLDLELLATDDQKAYVMTCKLFIPLPHLSYRTFLYCKSALSIWPRESAFACSQPYLCTHVLMTFCLMFPAIIYLSPLIPPPFCFYTYPSSAPPPTHTKPARSACRRSYEQWLIPGLSPCLFYSVACSHFKIQALQNFMYRFRMGGCLEGSATPQSANREGRGNRSYW